MWKPTTPLYLLGAICGISATLWAHPGHAPRRSSDGAVRTWSRKDSDVREQGDYVLSRDRMVQIRRDDDALVNLRLDSLSPADRAFVQLRQAEVRESLTAPLQLAQGGTRRGESSPPPSIAGHFDPFVKLKAIQTRWDDRWLYVESSGIPDHQMMVGITAWQQQVPLPQKYVGENAWRIPLHPVPAGEPLSAKTGFFRGAIAVAVNGIPIFNPIKNDGRTDTLQAGELDEFGGHCGRADDYHYHIAPVHLQAAVGAGNPIAYALDGYPIYGYTEPDGSPAKALDEFNGHTDANGNYHYHATTTYPYLNGGFHGEVVEREGQVDPQPRAEPVRPALPPLRDATISGFTEQRPGTFQLTYEVDGTKGTVTYTLADKGAVKFVFTDTDGRTTTENYTPRRDGGNPGGGQSRPRRAREDQPQRPENGNPGPPDGNPSRRRGRRPPPRGDDAPAANDQPRRPNQPTGGQSSPEDSRIPRLKVTSSSLDQRGRLHAACTCDGDSESPAVTWSDAPEGTKSFAVSLWHTAQDQEKSYWVVYNIPAHVTELPQNGTGIGTLGQNGKGRTEYDPMCSKGPGLKTYHITVFALSAELQLDPEAVDRAQLLEAVKSVTLAEGTLDYLYERTVSQ